MKIILQLFIVLIFTTGITQNAPIDFEPGGFGDTWTWTVFENDTNSALEIVTNPDPSGINTSETVAKFTALQAGQPFAGAAFFAGSAMGLTVPIDFSISESVSIKTWSPKADIPVRLKLEGPGGEFIELDVNTTLENEWETLTWDFTGQTAGVDWLTVVLFFEFVIDLPGDGTTYYYDDIRIAEPLEIYDNETFLIRAYPNPVTNYLNLESLEEISEIKLFNILGQNIFNTIPNNNKYLFDMTEFNAGIYFIKVKSIAGKVSTLKVLKN